MPNAQTYTEDATTLGTARGKSAASWRFDGNTSTETYVAFLTGFEDGDPETLDAFGPATGWLSGEYADDPTPTTLHRTLSTPEDDDLRADVEDAYESAAEDAYWAELVRVATYQTEGGE